MKKPFPIFNAKEQCKAFYFYDVLKRKVLNKRMMIINMKKPFFSSTQQAYKSKKGARHFIQGGRVYTFFFRPTIATAVALSRLSVCRVHTYPRCICTMYMYVHYLEVRQAKTSQAAKNFWDARQPQKNSTQAPSLLEVVVGVKNGLAHNPFQLH